ncbi:MAG: hypothetical protein KAV41_01855 [Candidatus Pacebacteria bacterium]|nr:hypothetical protein [Candidatus Paceibacterota bacterium]
MDAEVIKCNKCGDLLATDEGYYDEKKSEWLCHLCKTSEELEEEEKCE